MAWRGAVDNTSEFEIQLIRVGCGLLGLKIDEVLDLTPAEFLKYWDAYLWSGAYRHEANYANRIIYAIVDTSMGKKADKEKVLRNATITDPGAERREIENQIDNLNEIKRKE